jgi:hypothetical protein
LKKASMCLLNTSINNCIVTHFPLFWQSDQISMPEYCMASEVNSFRIIYIYTNFSLQYKIQWFSVLWFYCEVAFEIVLHLI